MNKCEISRTALRKAEEYWAASKGADLNPTCICLIVPRIISDYRTETFNFQTASAATENNIYYGNRKDDDKIHGGIEAFKTEGN